MKKQNDIRDMLLTKRTKFREYNKKLEKVYENNIELWLSLEKISKGHEKYKPLLDKLLERFCPFYGNIYVDEKSFSYDVYCADFSIIAWQGYFKYLKTAGWITSLKEKSPNKITVIFKNNMKIKIIQC